MNPLLKIKPLAPDLNPIAYAKEGDAGIDLRASGHWIIQLDSEKKEIQKDQYELQAGERILIKTGIKAALPHGHYGHIQDRSSLAYKHGLHVLAGIIDENYREEICVVLLNLGKNPYTLTKNERIAQMIIKEYKRADISYITYIEKLDETNRNAGFGSSGKY